MKLSRLVRAQWFLLTMGGLFLLAWAVPGLPVLLNPAGFVRTLAILLIFFISGLSLRPVEAFKGLASWPLHLFIQLFSFLLFPVLTYLVLLPFDTLPDGLRAGFYLLSVLPITITSCVVFTQLAGGNFAGALFNAVFGNLLGVFLSPVLFLLLLGNAEFSIEVDPFPIFRKLAMLVIAPLLAGQVLRRLARHEAEHVRRGGIRVNQGCVLFIAFMAFGQIASGDRSVWSGGGIFLPLASILPAHLAMVFLAWGGARLLRFRREDLCAVVFCAPQKTLALGLPMAAAVFDQYPEIAGLAALPIIVYHPVELFVAGLLLDWFRKRNVGR